MCSNDTIGQNKLYIICSIDAAIGFYIKKLANILIVSNHKDT